MRAYRTLGAALATIVVLLVLGSFGIAGALAPHGGATAPAAASHHASPSTLHSDVAAFAAAAAQATPNAASLVPAAPSAPYVVAGASGAAPAAAPTGGRMSSTVASLDAAGVPMRDAFLPDLNANPHPSLTAAGTISPTYTSGPAPLGVAEYGLVNQSGTIVPWNLTTDELVGIFEGQNQYCTFLATCSPSVLSMDSGVPDAYGLQLNAVVENVTLFNQPGYSFWTQNVVEYSTYTEELYIITNVWNFSSPTAVVHGNEFVDHGANGTIVPGEFYYSVSGPYIVPSNYSIFVGLVSGVNGTNDEVGFEFELEAPGGGPVASGINDFVVFNSSGASGPGVAVGPQFVADGGHYAPNGLPADWEFVMGGPGGGSNVDLLSMYATIDLFYYNETLDTISPVPSAYTVGSETGETAYGGTDLWNLTGQFPLGYIVPGPTYAQGMWNFTNSTEGVAFVVHSFAPDNGFTFLAPQDANPLDFQSYQWAPFQSVYFLPPGTYSAWSVASNYYPAYSDLGVLANDTLSFWSVSLSYNPLNGVYTPLWALNQSGLENITWDGYTLFNNQYAPLGYDPVTGYHFPWFGIINDYTFPIFAGILLWNTASAAVLAPPSFDVVFPSWDDAFLNYYGFPTTNDLPMMFYDSIFPILEGASAIGGWWFTQAYFGPTTPQYDVVFWNTSYGTIVNNTFATGGNALYLYGGSENLILNNTFIQALPNASNPFVISGYYYGTYALFEADYGDVVYGGFDCGCHDMIFNNIFDTYFTAYSPYLDPYTGNFPIYPFSEEWNISQIYGIPNIIGGDWVGGNYWWNYGTSQNPYGQLPYYNYQFYYTLLWGLEPYGIYYGGDYLPLTLGPVYTVTFVEVGLPAGTVWSPVVVGADDFDVTNYTNTTTANESWVAGTYNLTAEEFASGYQYNGSATLVVTGNETVTMNFTPLFLLSFVASGLPTGTLWAVELLASNFTFYENYSITAWANFSLPAGDYEFEAYAFDYFGAPDGFGTVSLTTTTFVTVDFLPVYTITFDLTGLPVGYGWTVIVQSNGPSGNGSAGFNTSSGEIGYVYGGYTYDWWITAPGYVGTPASGAIDLAGNTTVDVSFAASASVTVDESGLPAGTAWTVFLTQGANTTEMTSTASTMTFSAVAGAFNYTARAAGYAATNGTGSGTLPLGGPVHVSFAPAPTSIEFDATGLPGTLTWYVNLTQGVSTQELSGTGDLSTGAVYGPYTYTVAAPGYTAIPASGSGVLPSDSPVEISFSPTPATVSFSETGLPVGTLWTVSFTQGASTIGYTGTGTIVVPGVYGAYTYHVGSANYTATVPSGSGSLPTDSSVSVTFSIHDGTVTGTVLPTTATLTIGGTGQSLSGTGAYTDHPAPGTWAVVVKAAGYYTYYGNVSVAAGKTTYLNVTLQAIPSSPTPLLGVSGSTGWIVIAALAAVALILLGTTLLFMGRARRPPQMTQYSGSNPPAGGGKPEWSESEPGTPPAGKT